MQPAAFTALWTADQIRRIRQAGLVGQPIRMTFGGPHISAPRYSRAGVRVGDDVIPIQVKDGRLLLLARVRVGAVVPVEDFVDSHPGWFARFRDHAEFRRMEPYLRSPRDRAFWLMKIWLETTPEFGAWSPGESDEVVIAAESTPFRVDRVVPGEIVGALRWQSGKRPERPIKHLAADGRIERSVSLQGIYRLTAASAEQLRRLLD